MIRASHCLTTAAVLALALGAAGSCQLDTDTIVCDETGIRCPPGSTCTLEGDGCTFNGCGNGIVDPGEICDDGNVRDNDNCASDCFASFLCGNGVIDVTEICDDGNNVSGDGCSADCMSNETCGNGYFDVAAGESCDDGNLIAGDGCSPFCGLELCGNGSIDPGEVCDDGNDISGDGCRSDCLSTEICGNGLIDVIAGEQCDDGFETATCDADCTIVECGDGYTNMTVGEECDDANTQDGDGCAADCTIE